MHSAAEREAEIDLLQELLALHFPESYRKFLTIYGSGAAYGLPLLGLPVSLDETSAWGATEIVRAARPDLGSELLAVRLIDSRALCLDLRDPAPHDVGLVEVWLDSQEPLVPVHNSFTRYLQDGERSDRRIESALKRLRWLVTNGPNYDHAFEAKEPPFKARQWRVIRSCLHDHIVGLTAVRHNEVMNALEVDVFLSTDHPDYETGHGVKALAILLLSDAYRNGSVMEIRFTRGARQRVERAPVGVPQDLVELARTFGISFEREAGGVVAHEEAVRLYAALTGFAMEAVDAIGRAETRRLLTLQGLCYSVSTRLWTVEEATWVLLNFREPHRLLLGGDVPEDRPCYAESLSYGRAALAGTKLCHRLSGGDSEAHGSCEVKIEGPLWRITPQDDQILDWKASGGLLLLSQSHPIVVLPRPRIVFPDERKRIWEDAKTLSASDDSCPRFLLYGADHRGIEDIERLAAEVAAATGVGLLILPFACQELNEEVDQRMGRARVMRS